MINNVMKIIGLFFSLMLIGHNACSWGFFGHRLINEHAVYLLPPGMMVLYKPNIGFLSEHAVDPDKRRYIVAAEGPRHYIDINHYGTYPYTHLPRYWPEAVEQFGEDSLLAHGIVPWWVYIIYGRLTRAFMERNKADILKYSAELGHYIADAHVPLHATDNYNGQKTGQHGIHGLWESRIPELLAHKEWDFFIGKAEYIKDPQNFIWNRVLESALAADTVLRAEREVSLKFARDRKYAFEERNETIIRQYSAEFVMAYDKAMNHMVERRMRLAIYSVASFWYTSWVNAGQPDLSTPAGAYLTSEEPEALKKINRDWKSQKPEAEVVLDCDD